MRQFIVMGNNPISAMNPERAIAKHFQKETIFRSKKVDVREGNELKFFRTTKKKTTENEKAQHGSEFLYKYIIKYL